MRIDCETWNVISADISQRAERPFLVESVRPISGGDINQSFIISGHHTAYFVKLNDAALLPMFEQEAFSLNRLLQTRTFTVPAPVTHGTTQGHSYLVLTCHDIQGDGDFFVPGRRLADLHRNTHTHHGWDHDNHIGSTRQQNKPTSSWLAFWRDRRLWPQLELAYKNGHSPQLSQPAGVLLDALPAILADHEPQPSLLHGDLWHGNMGFVARDEPILFDPAAYYGDRETDLALTELFGGFRTEFYVGYNEAWPLPAGYQKRKPLYQLYHMLNHLNLFGASYIGSCTNLINRLISVAG